MALSTPSAFVSLIDVHSPPRKSFGPPLPMRRASSRQCIRRRVLVRRYGSRLHRETLSFAIHHGLPTDFVMENLYFGKLAGR